MTPSDQLDFQPIVETLVKNEVDFVLIGGLAGILHGSAHMTVDIDIVYARDRKNLERLAVALQQLQATLRGAPKDLPLQLDAQMLHNGWTFTFETTFGDLDILAEPDGSPPYAELKARSVEADLYGHAVHVASLDDLIAMKRAAGRTKDLLHISEYLVISDQMKGIKRRPSWPKHPEQ